jgi:polysaccharide deacetylase family protein (PEP-CTERM system associated)
MSGNQNANTFLFSVDLEDIRLRMPDGKSFKERVPQNTEAYLKWLNKTKSKCTFFVTGDVAELYPSLINEIVQEGHEIACHTSFHIPLDKQTPDEFAKDLENNMNVLTKAGAKKIEGFRAPVFSLIKKTKWAYDVLKKMNFSYSSSVLPAQNPLYGWKEFGSAPRKMENGIVEIPMTVGKFGPMTLPAVGGVYFRVLPRFVISNLVKKIRAEGLPVLGYFHPYDIDTEQEKFMHPGISDSRFYNFLMNYNRRDVFPRLDNLMVEGFKISTYKSFSESVS